MIRFGIVGYGYWGPNVARNVCACPKARLVAICDGSVARLKSAAAAFPFARTCTDADELMRADDIDVVAVITPVATHFPLARKAIERGKNVFVEKPFTASSAQAEELIALAARQGTKIMVDHTFLFTGAVRKMREIIRSGELGDLLFYDSVRVNLGLFQHDCNVIWDLAPHDFSILNHLVDQRPVAVRAVGAVHFGIEHEDVAYISVEFDNHGFIAHFHCNWLSPVKVRKTMISGSKKMLVWDDISSDEKIKIYDRGVEIRSAEGLHDLLVSYRSGDVYVPKVDGGEALKRDLEYFIECIEGGTQPFNNGESGLLVVRMLEAADESIKNGGKKVRL